MVELRSVRAGATGLGLWVLVVAGACQSADEPTTRTETQQDDLVGQPVPSQAVPPTPSGDAGSGTDAPPGSAFSTDSDDAEDADPSDSSGATDKPTVPETPAKAEPCAVAGCPAGLACTDGGFCITPPPACTGDADCPGHHRCGLTGECLAPGGCRVSADCDMAESCRAEVCTVGSDCGQTELIIDPVVPNVLVLLDISRSMADPPQGPCMRGENCGLSKMRIAEQAMAQMTASYRDRIRWGLAMFAGDAVCSPPVNVIVPDVGNEDMLNAYISQVVTPVSLTPINASIASVQASTYLSDGDRPNYLLFVSDGGESCGGDNNDTRQRIAAMQASGIGTFVVGFGNGVDVIWLNQFAEAGGHPNPSGTVDPATGMTRAFYAADDASGLEQALGAILGSVVGCDFALTDPPDDPDAVWAFFDDVLVERDDPDGWRLDTASAQVSFVGASCERLQRGDVRDIDIVFGCPEPVLE